MKITPSLKINTLHFSLMCPVDFKTNEHIALLAVLNNLMANAVEAIEQQDRFHYIEINRTDILLSL